MVQSKNVEKLALGVILAAVLACLIMVVLAPKAAKADSSGADRSDYEQMLFDTNQPMTIDIVMEPDNWQEMLQNAAQKKWYSCDVIVNGTTYHNVGIRTKGDASLESIADNPNSNRYSFKLSFGKYQKGQRCWGLDKLCLNNNCGDPTGMKEALVYDMAHFFHMPAPLYNFAKISLNGEYWGVYLALEAVDHSFLKRNYALQPGALYKPGESGEADDGGWDESEYNESAMEAEEKTSEVIGGGSDLRYIDDRTESYFAIWAAQVNKSTESDHRRVVKALKNIGEQNALETYMDIENVIRYMVVHNFSVNYDSLSGDGDHNYYLHEKDGKLSIIPWDYNLCFGAYTMDSEMDDGHLLESLQYASRVVNSPIDDHWALTNFFDGILDSEEYRAKYHAYYQRLIEQYVLSGGFEAFYKRTRSQIDELVKTDPNALYSYDAYDAAAKMLQLAVELRGQSVRGQLAGVVPSTAAGQKEHPETLIDASSVNLQTMGSDSAGEAPENEISEEEWMNQYKEKAEQQTKARQEASKKAAAQYLFSFLGLSAALLGIRWYNKHFEV